MSTQSGHTTAIRASRTIGTSVYNTAGDKIGKVEDVVLDKTDNTVLFAVVGFGGFMGMGEKYHPVPWSSLNFSEERDGYVVPFTEDQLKAAPANDIDELTRNDGHAIRDSAYSYYKVKPYWM
ncbi:PRC-barrel domain-containing protein [Hyphomonas sp.]|uniref:PRC-barrel domain-containing protein n=1 Tax=Hyphomonas sp. TaxID=87 RepID=UPI00391C0430